MTDLRAPGLAGIETINELVDGDPARVFSERAAPHPKVVHLRPLPREEFRGMTLEQWVEQNVDRIWAVMLAGDLRDRSFNDIAEQLWSQL